MKFNQISLNIYIIKLPFQKKIYLVKIIDHHSLSLSLFPLQLSIFHSFNKHLLTKRNISHRTNQLTYKDFAPCSLTSHRLLNLCTWTINIIYIFIYEVKLAPRQGLKTSRQFLNEGISRKTQFLDATSQREQFQLQQKETIQRSSMSFYGIVADSTAQTVFPKARAKFD